MASTTQLRLLRAGLLTAILVLSMTALAACAQKPANRVREAVSPDQKPDTAPAALALQDVALGLMSSGSIAEVKSVTPEQSGLLAAVVPSVDATEGVLQIDSITFKAGGDDESPYEMVNQHAGIDSVSPSPEFVAMLWGTEGPGLGRPDTARYVTADWDEFVSLYSKMPLLSDQLESTGAFIVLRDQSVLSLIQIYAP